jgi:4-aminobutyrate aminotransferase-like enzyme
MYNVVDVGVSFRLNKEHVLLSADGPNRNVLKFKPPMCFTKQNVDDVVEKLCRIFSELEAVDNDDAV